jgi:hypothetical protein
MLLVALVFLVPAEVAAAYAGEDNRTLGIVVYLALGLLGYPWAYAALTAVLERRVRSPFEPYGRTVDRLPALALVNFAAGIAVVIGLLLLIIPGLLLSARWSAAGPLIVLDRRGPFQGLESSNGLVRGRTWSVVGALVIVFVVASIVSIPAAVASLSETTWVSGLGAAAFDTTLFLPLTALAYAVYRTAPAGQ